MPTIRERLDWAIDKGVPIEDLKARMQKLGIKKEDIDLDVDVAKAKGAERLGSGTRDVMASVGLDLKAPTIAPKPVEAVQAPVMPVAPKVQPEAPVEAVGLPSEVQETVQERDVPDIQMKGGFTDLGSSAKRAAGFMVGLFGGAAGSVAGMTEPSFEDVKRIKEGSKEAAIKGRAQELEEQKKGEVDVFSYDFAKNALNDALDLVTALPKVATLALGSFEVKPGEDFVGKAVKAGEMVIPGMLGSTAAAIENPGKHIKAHPIMFLFDIYPAAKGVSTAVKGTKAATATAATAASVTEKVEDLAKPLTSKFNAKYGESLAPQRFIDLYTTRDSRVTQFMEEAFAEGDKAESLVGRAGERLVKGTDPKESAQARSAIKKATGKPVRELFSDDTYRDNALIEITKNLKEGVPEKLLKAIGFEGQELEELILVYKKRGSEGLIHHLDDEQRNMVVGNILGQKAAWAKIVGEKEAARQNKAIKTQMFSNIAKDARQQNISKVMKGESDRFKKELIHSVDATSDVSDIKPLSLGQKPLAIETNARNIDDYIKEVGLNVSDSEILKDKLKGMQYRESDGFRGLVDHRVAYVMDVQNAEAHGSTFLKNLNIILSKLPKQVALPMNPRAIINNVMGNEFATAMRFGTIPFSPERLVIANRYRLWKKGPKKATPLIKTGAPLPSIERVSHADEMFFSSMERSGMFDSNLIKKDIDLLSSVGTGNIIGGIEKAGDFIASFGGKAMSFGDEVYKLDVARKEYDRALGFLNKLKDKEHINIPVGPNQSIRITKNGDKFMMRRVTTGRGVFSKRSEPVSKLVASGKIVNGVPAKKLSDALARFGAHSAFTQFFNYGRIPGYLSTIRKTPAVGAGSVFFTWQNKALDVPFMKQGLGSAIFGGPAGITTNSNAVRRNIISDGIKLSMRRAAISGLAEQAGREDPEARKMMSWDPKNPSISVATKLSDPTTLALNRFGSSNWLEPSLNLMGASLSLIAPGKKEVAEHIKTLTSEEKSLEQKKAAYRRGIKVLHEMGTSNKEVIPTALKLIGLGGGILMDAYSDIMDAEKQGRTVDVFDLTKKVYLPSWARGLGDAEAKRYKGVSTGKEAVEDAVSFHFRNFLGLGYQQINSLEAYKRYRNGAAREMSSQMQIWKDKKTKELRLKQLSTDPALKEQAIKEFKELATKEVLFKDLVKDALEEMDTNFYSSLKGK